MQRHFARMLIQGQLHLCLRKVHPNIRYNPLLQYVCRKRHPPHTRLLGQHMRLSFASCTLQPPLLQTSPSPWPSAFPLPLHPLDEEGGPIKRHIAIQMKTSYISVGLSLLSKGLRGGKERSDRVERRPFVSQYPYVYDVIRILFGDFSTNVSGDRIMAWMIGKRDSFGWYHRVQTRCYREGTLTSKASH